MFVGGCFTGWSGNHETELVLVLNFPGNFWVLYFIPLDEEDYSDTMKLDFSGAFLLQIIFKRTFWDAEENTKTQGEPQIEL